ncbi:helix-turn-helix transcriptional regulator [Azospirillum sp. TSH58]|uniref:helix-turn-helix domain-containing protein n=1 Tax=Azospirillum sp. TSH58 TaxID=664962 RepID=UPI0013A5BCEB|nr:helix-turn-helix domain-containing protein [Azospirillum sp. TSH58]
MSERLRELRQRAGISLDELAKEAGFKGQSSLQRYEDPEAYKRPYFRVDFVDRIIGPLTKRGIPKAEVLALAGINVTEEPAMPPDALHAHIVQVAVEALAVFLEETKLALPPAKQASLIVDFCRAYGDEVAAGTQPATPDVAHAISLLRLFHRGRAG